MNALTDWECYLLPASLLAGVDRLPLHEACRSKLEHVRIHRSVEAIRHELGARSVCAVSWRWSGLPSPAATFAELAEWSPMSDLQLARLKELIARSRSSYVWIDWTCVPQLGDDTMAFINATYDIYSLSPAVMFLPRIHPFPRRGWPALSPDAADHAVEVVRTVANGVLEAGSFSPAFKRIIRDAARADRLEEKLSALAERKDVSRHIESVFHILHPLLAGDAVAFPSFDYYTRAWTLAERLAVFKPSRESPIRIGDLHSAGDAFLYTLSSFWRDVERHAGAYVPGGRPSVSPSDLVFAVHVRGVDPSEVDAEERWDDMNRMVQLSPGMVGIGSETAALAVICVEWLLHEATGTTDETGMVAATLLGECVAFMSIAIATATLQEEATPTWFRKYLHFQAGSVYGSTIPADLILAVYRSCGLAERPTAEDAVESSRREAFGDEPVSGGIEILCSEALRHDDVHTHLWTRGTGEEPLSATDFVPMLKARSRTPLDVGSWIKWMTETGIVVSWWFSQPDQTLPVDPTALIDIEHLYCGELLPLHGLSLDRVLRSTVTVVYKIHRQDDHRWRLLQLSFSRRDGRCGEGLSPFRISRKLELEPLLGRDILRDGRAATDLIGAWHRRLLESLDADLHPIWMQCPFSSEIGVMS